MREDPDAGDSRSATRLRTASTCSSPAVRPSGGSFGGIGTLDADTGCRTQSPVTTRPQLHGGPRCLTPTGVRLAWCPIGCRALTNGRGSLRGRPALNATSVDRWSEGSGETCEQQSAGAQPIPTSLPDCHENVTSGAQTSQLRPALRAVLDRTGSPPPRSARTSHASDALPTSARYCPIGRARPNAPQSTA